MLRTRPSGANVNLLEPGFHKATARVDVVVRQLLFYLREADPVRHEFVGVNTNLVFASDSAEADYVNHVRNGFELLLQYPILKGLQFHQVVAWICAFEGIPVNLADRAVIGADLRLQSSRQADLGEALEHLLAVQIVTGLIVEDQHHTGQAEQGCGAQVIEVWDSVHYDLDRNRNLLLHLFRGPSGPLRDDLDVVVRNVRVGFDR